MCDGRLSSIAILSIESARAEAIDLNKFIDEFDLRHGNIGNWHCTNTEIEYNSVQCHVVVYCAVFRLLFVNYSYPMMLFLDHEIFVRQLLNFK